MKNLSFRLLAACIAWGMSLQGHAQVIWQESFSYPNGTTTGSNNNTANPAADWTSSCATCVAGDWYSVQNNMMEGLDTNGPAVLTTESIDISAFGTGVELLVNLSEAGTLEGCPSGASCGCNCIDWIRVEISVNGGGFTNLSSPLGGACAGSCAGATYVTIDDFTSHAFSQCPIVGNTLQIRITVQCWAAEEFMRVDNLIVQGASCVLNATDFQAWDLQDEVMLEWTTSAAMEHFVIERSLNGAPFTPLAELQAVGGQDRYTYSDPEDFSGLALYRIIEHDANGAQHLSETRRVYRDADAESSLLLHPNPSEGLVRFDAQGQPLDKVEVYDLSGKLLLSQATGAQSLGEIDLSALQAGIYLVRAHSGTRTMRGRVVLQ